MDNTAKSSNNTLIFIGGLGDGLLTVPYTPSLAQNLQNYCLAELLISSSYTGFGTSSLSQDVVEIAQCVKYFRQLRPDGKIVLMGHSTGCQDVMHYLISPGQRPKIDGAIMQASISDREAIDMLADPKDLIRGVALAQSYAREGKEDDVLPGEVTNMMFPAPMSAKRYLSLVSPGPEHAGEDDYFSSDFDDDRLKRTFGKLGKTGTPMLILYSQADPHVPEGIDTQLLLGRWVRHIKDGGGVVDQGSGVVANASHTLKELGRPAKDVFERVAGFLKRLEQDT